MTDPTHRPETECGDFVPVRPPGSPGAQGIGAGPDQGGLAGPVRRLARLDSARLTVLSGPSAVGKSTVIETMRRRNPEVWLSISVTTRAPRPGEVHGREYFFVTEDEFKQMAASGQLLEWARYAGNFYGTPKEPVAERLSAGLPSLLEVDVVGARQVRAAVPGALLVFLAPPSWDELVRRLTGRGTESAEVIEKRLAAARDELQAEHEFDITLVNTSVVDVCAQLVGLMLAQPVRLPAHALSAPVRAGRHTRRVDGGRYSGARGNHQPADR